MKGTRGKANLLVKKNRESLQGKGKPKLDLEGCILFLYLLLVITIPITTSINISQVIELPTNNRINFVQEKNSNPFVEKSLKIPEFEKLQTEKVFISNIKTQQIASISINNLQTELKIVFTKLDNLSAQKLDLSENPNGFFSNQSGESTFASGCTSQETNSGGIGIQSTTTTECYSPVSTGGCTGLSCGGIQSVMCSSCSSINPSASHLSSCTPPSCPSGYYSTETSCSINTGACNKCSGSSCNYACSYQQKICTRTCLKCDDPYYPTYCNGKCWHCNSGYTLCCPNSGDPSWCCSNPSNCHSDGRCCTDQCSSSGQKRCNGNVAETCYFNSGNGCYEWQGTSCVYGCSNGQCNTCKPNGQTCSQPGTSTSECCSGICQIDGKCGADTCTHDCSPQGATRCKDSSTKQTCGYYDADICLEWGNEQSCICQSGNCATTTKTYGYLKDLDNKPISGATVKFTDCSDNDIISNLTKPDGFFSLSTSTGNYKLKFVMPFGTITLIDSNGNSCFLFAGDIDLGTINIRTNFSLTGKVQDEFKNPIKNAQIKLTDCSDNLITSNYTDNYGNFTIKNKYGDYKLKVNYNSKDYLVLDCTNFKPEDYSLNGPIIIPIKTHIIGKINNEFGSPRNGLTVQLTDCSDNLITSKVTNSTGDFELVANPGNYKIKINIGFATILLVINDKECNYYDIDYISFTQPIVISTKTNIRGYIKELSGNPINNQKIELYDCSDNLITSNTTNSLGLYSLKADAGKYKLKLVIGGNRYLLEDSNGNSCFTFFGDINLDITVGVNCSQYDYSCYNTDWKLFNCFFKPNEAVCSCYYEACDYGCTPGALECDFASGNVYVDVANSIGNPLSGAKIYSDNSYIGNTDSYGKITVQAGFGYRTIKVECSDGTYCGSKTVYVNGKEYLYFNCNCQSSEVLVHVSTVRDDCNVPGIKNCPIANAFVQLDGVNIGMTNPIGYVSAPSVTLGNHEVKAYLYLQDAPNSENYQWYSVSKNINVDQSLENVEFVITKDVLTPQQIQQFGVNSKEVAVMKSDVQPEGVIIVVATVVVIALVVKQSFDYSYECVGPYLKERKWEDKCWLDTVFMGATMITLSPLGKMIGTAISSGGAKFIKIVEGIPGGSTVIEYVGGFFRFITKPFKSLYLGVSDWFGAKLITAGDDIIVYGNTIKNSLIRRIIVSSGSDLIEIGGNIITKELLLKYLSEAQLGDEIAVRGALAEIWLQNYAEKSAIATGGRIFTGENGDIVGHYTDNIGRNIILRFKESSKNIAIKYEGGSLIGEFEGLIEKDGVYLALEAKSGTSASAIVNDLDTQIPKVLEAVSKGVSNGKPVEAIVGVSNGMKSKVIEEASGKEIGKLINQGVVKIEEMSETSNDILRYVRIVINSVKK